LQLSTLGRTGITHWLQGNNDAQGAFVKAWDNWITTHPGQENQYFDWLNRPSNDPRGGFGVQQWDPRVFQFMRLSPNNVTEDGETVNERREFLNAMSAPEKKRFLSRIQEYEQRGLLGTAQ
jgi:hypothetical protein